MPHSTWLDPSLCVWGYQEKKLQWYKKIEGEIPPYVAIGGDTHWASYIKNLLLNKDLRKKPNRQNIKIHFWINKQMPILNFFLVGCLTKIVNNSLPSLPTQHSSTLQFLCLHIGQTQHHSPMNEMRKMSMSSIHQSVKKSRSEKFPYFFFWHLPNLKKPLFFVSLCVL